MEKLNDKKYKAFVEANEAEANTEATSAISRREQEKREFDRQVALLSEQIAREAAQMSDDELPVIQRYASEADKLRFKKILIGQRMALNDE